MATLKIPVTKGKGVIEINTADPSEGGDLPAAVFQEALIQGLKVILNRGMTKITKETYPDSQELAVAAMAKAQQTLVDMRSGKIRIMGAKVDKVSGATMTEARRLARNLVKDEMKRQGIKVSYVEASEITKAANAYLATDDGKALIEQAKLNLAEREKEASKVSAAIDVAAIPISAKKKAKAESEKAKAKEQLSAAKAGKIKSKPKALEATS